MHSSHTTHREDNSRDAAFAPANGITYRICSICVAPLNIWTDANKISCPFILKFWKYFYQLLSQLSWHFSNITILKCTDYFCNLSLVLIRDIFNIAFVTIVSSSNCFTVFYDLVYRFWYIMNLIWLKMISIPLLIY